LSHCCAGYNTAEVKSFTVSVVYAPIASLDLCVIDVACAGSVSAVLVSIPRISFSAEKFLEIFSS
jgi:hypothetical protein